MIWHNTSNLGLPRSFSIFSIVRSSQPICSANLQKLAKTEAECIAAYYGVTKKEETTFTKIMGNAVATVEQMTEYIKAKNPDVAQSVIDMIPFYLSEGKAEGVVILPLHNPVWKQVILDSPVLLLRSTRTISVAWE